MAGSDKGIWKEGYRGSASCVMVASPTLTSRSHELRSEMTSNVIVAAASAAKAGVNEPFDSRMPPASVPA
jgi:hypothetical protein